MAIAEQQLILRFEGEDRAEASRLAQQLEQDLREIDPNVKASRIRDCAEAQDFGATLVLLFGTPFAVALAGGVAAFLKRVSGARITISKSGEVVAENLDSRDAARIAEAFAGARKAKG